MPECWGDAVQKKTIAILGSAFFFVVARHVAAYHRSAKRANESTSPGTPARINITPMTRVNSRPKNGGRSSQRVIDHGMSPANIQGDYRCTTQQTSLFI
jgi:hypothetical protein